MPASWKWRKEETAWLAEASEKEFAERELAPPKAVDYSLDNISARITKLYEEHFKDAHQGESEDDYQARVKKSHKNKNRKVRRIVGETDEECRQRLAACPTRIRGYLDGQSARYREALLAAPQITRLPPVAAPAGSAWKVFQSADCTHRDKPVIQPGESPATYQKRVSAAYHALSADDIKALEALGAEEAAPSNSSSELERQKKAAGMIEAITRQAQHWYEETGWVGLYIAGGPLEGGRTVAHILPIGKTPQKEDFEQWLVRRTPDWTSQHIRIELLAFMEKIFGNRPGVDTTVAPPVSDTVTIDSPLNDMDTAPDTALASDTTPAADTALAVADTATDDSPLNDMDTAPDTAPASDTTPAAATALAVADTATVDSPLNDMDTAPDTAPASATATDDSPLNDMDTAPDTAPVCDTSTLPEAGPDGPIATDTSETQSSPVMLTEAQPTASHNNRKGAKKRKSAAHGPTVAPAKKPRTSEKQGTTKKPRTSEKQGTTKKPRTNVPAAVPTAPPVNRPGARVRKASDRAAGRELQTLAEREEAERVLVQAQREAIAPRGAKAGVRGKTTPKGCGK
ncbi:hypothetical protein FA95DRAFT_1612692 [Auriscalpium vulgare]|uniref:Uncharacterized protein n=1 Tax=Auriscalpium vulgare TaxID=40419 RepID=A0ACB8R5B3_9AGAM|nr:hypothetical protein FA95DRAFT_1612692 [Auriscalpium vulgare]